MKMNKTAYQSPIVDVIDICAESIICASGEGDISVANIWEGNTEEEW